MSHHTSSSVFMKQVEFDVYSSTCGIGFFFVCLELHTLLLLVCISSLALLEPIFSLNTVYEQSTS